MRCGHIANNKHDDREHSRSIQFASSTKHTSQALTFMRVIKIFLPNDPYQEQPRWSKYTYKEVSMQPGSIFLPTTLYNYLQQTHSGRDTERKLRRRRKPGKPERLGSGFSVFECKVPTLNPNASLCPYQAPRDHTVGRCNEL